MITESTRPGWSIAKLSAAGPDRVVSHRNNFVQVQRFNHRFEVAELLLETVSSARKLLGSAIAQKVERDDTPSARDQIGYQIVPDVEIIWKAMHEDKGGASAFVVLDVHSTLLMGDTVLKKTTHRYALFCDRRLSSDALDTNRRQNRRVRLDVSDALLDKIDDMRAPSRWGVTPAAGARVTTRLLYVWKLRRSANFYVGVRLTTLGPRGERLFAVQSLPFSRAVAFEFAKNPGEVALIHEATNHSDIREV